MLESNVPEKFAIKLSTGYEVEVDLGKSSRMWLPHLARAVVGERFFEESKAAKKWRPEVISEEIRYLLVTIPTEQKEAIFGQIIWDAVMRVYKRIERRAMEENLTKPGDR